MADAPAQDQGAVNFARGVGGGATSGGAQDDGRNTEEDANSDKDMLIDWALGGAGRGVVQLQKLLFGTLGFRLGQLGKTSLAKVFGGDTDGIAGQNIMPTAGGIAPDTPGGVLYQIAKALVRRREVTPQVDGVGGNPFLADNASGGGGGGAGAGGESGSGGGDIGGGHSFASYAAGSGLSEVFIQAGGVHHFEYRSVSESILGTISPPTFGEPGLGRGAGFGLAA
jgi:hypothetical protein